MAKNDSTKIREQIQILHDHGVTVVEMARMLNVTKNTILYHRKRMGITTPKGKLTQDDRVAMKQMKKKSMSLEEIGLTFNVKRNAVNRVLRDADTSTRSIEDVLKIPMNRFLARRWTAQSVRDCLL